MSKSTATLPQELNSFFGIVVKGDTDMAFGRKSLIAVGLLAVLFSAPSIFVPSARALSFNASDVSMNYLIVSGTPDVIEPGGAVSVNVTAKLSANSSEQDVFRITLLVDTDAEMGKIVSQGDLILPSDGTPATARFSVAIPSDAINNTYLYLNMNDGSKSYSKISISLIQNPSYLALQSKVQILQSQNSNLRQANNDLSIIMYAAIFVAIVFIVTTSYILVLTFRAKKNKKEDQTIPQV